MDPFSVRRDDPLLPAPFRVLVLYFSQTGESARVARAIAEPLTAAGHQVVIECLRPMHAYPYPWRNPVRFFNVLPECLLGPPPEMQSVSFDVTSAYDLIILVYPVWFLSPSLPTQGFLASADAQVLRGRRVISISVSRNMWHSAAQRMKRLLRAAGAVLIDQVCVTHQGPPWATFITAPRALLFGRTEPFWGIFPAAGLGEREIQRVRQLGDVLQSRLSGRSPDDLRSLLNGTDAVTIQKRYLVPEAVGWYVFMAWAYVLKGLGRIGRWARMIGVLGFMAFIVCAVGIGIPLLVVVTFVLTPFVRGSIQAYADRLASPTGTALADKGRSEAQPMGI